jgi:hypothetical protein
MSRFILRCLILALFVAPAFALEGVEVSGVEHRVLEGPDEDGELYVSFKATVKNTFAEERELEVWLQAVDKDGYEVFDVPLKGRFKPSEQRTLTDTQWIKEKLYKTIVKWQVEE